ncbi:MarR family winged helix-turn-helix transcriptional regulator [Paracoccus sediminilitoris]|uniref:MarR family winged helix-turn-helix transcriptional regulator n=1 Tax=Paracoccus sediminilitoris TaxID=2202419 RepID=UPI000DB9722F|nr:MarR family winged helix-turn-helix transcriptional regulator [Paracoccus sediminilitoris]
MHNDPLLARLLNSDLRELLSISHIVLANNQVTNRHIERHYDMPVQCWSTLYAVALSPGLRARDVMRVFPRPQNTVSRAVNQLEQRGLIVQRPSADDGRAKQLFPTLEGIALSEDIRVAVLKRQAEIFGVLTQDERSTLVALCHKVVSNPDLYQSAAMPGGD